MIDAMSCFMRARAATAAERRGTAVTCKGDRALLLPQRGVGCGSSGGHHGLESIEQHLGSREFSRLRLGIGRQDGAREITDYVLSRLDRTEAALMEKVLDRASCQAECWLNDGIERAMNQFNGVVDS